MSGKSIRAGKGEVTLGIKDKLRGGLRKARNRLLSFSKSIAKIGLGAGAVGGGLALAIAPAISRASELQERMSKFNTVFGQNSQAVKQWGDEFAGQVGRSKSEVVGFLASTQDLLVPMGLEPGAATNMSQDLTRLGVDLASFNNMADADVMNDLQAALTGSGEVMKKYGVVLSEAAVKQELLNQGINPKAASNAQKVQARYNLILAGTTAAQGDAIRTSGSFANQMKGLKAAVSDAAAEIGSKILPLVTKVLSLGRAMIVRWQDTWAILRDSGLLFVVRIWEEINHTFTTRIPTILNWFAGNWQNFFRDIGMGMVTAIKNAAITIKDIFVTIWDFIRSGFEGGFAGVMSDIGEIAGRDLLEGFEATTKPIPKIAERQATAYEKSLQANIEQAATNIAEEAFGKAEDKAEEFQTTTIDAGEAAAAATAAADDARKKAEQGLNQQSSKLSGFSASTLNASFGGKDLQDKIRKATEETAKHTREMALARNIVPLVFT